MSNDLPSGGIRDVIQAIRDSDHVVFFGRADATGTLFSEWEVVQTW